MDPTSAIIRDHISTMHSEANVEKKLQSDSSSTMPVNAAVMDVINAVKDQISPMHLEANEENKLQSEIASISSSTIPTIPLPAMPPTMPPNTSNSMDVVNAAVMDVVNAIRDQISPMDSEANEENKLQSGITSTSSSTIPPTMPPANPPANPPTMPTNTSSSMDVVNVDVMDVVNAVRDQISPIHSEANEENKLQSGMASTSSSTAPPTMPTNTSSSMDVVNVDVMDVVNAVRDQISPIHSEANEENKLQSGMAPTSSSTAPPTIPTNASYSEKPRELSSFKDVVNAVRNQISTKHSKANPNEEKKLQPEKASTKISNDDYTWTLPLIKALHEGNWESAKRFFDIYPNAVSIRINPFGETALYVIARAGKVRFTRELVRLMPPEALELKTNLGATALSIAAAGGFIEIAEIMVTKNANLLCMQNAHGFIPVVEAALNGNKDMVHYLYSATKETSPETLANRNGATLLTLAILSDIYGVALDLLNQYPTLATTPDFYNRTAVSQLSKRPSAFPSGCQHNIWQQFIYACIPVQGHIQRRTDNSHGSFNSVIKRMCGPVLSALKFLVPGIKQIHDTKLIHAQSLEVLKILCTQISVLNVPQLLEAQVYSAIFQATELGIVEFIVEILEWNPFLLWCIDEHERGIFSVAIIHRQEKIFNLLHDMGEKKDIANCWDKYHNTMLHLAAMVAPSSQLYRISGAAFQMQRELQWFKEVEKIVQPRTKDLVNMEGKTPRALFTEKHKELVKEGETWMKETSQACMVVATLIATVMFTAAFTVPGGNNSDKGIPIFLQNAAFMVFIISDAVSLFSSCTSVLMFLAILASRYAEEDFLRSLPKKLIIGLVTLFFSITTMMSAFGATLVIVLREKLKWIIIPVILMASIPVTLFALLQFPLFVDIIFNSYGSGIFRRPTKRLHQ